VPAVRDYVPLGKLEVGTVLHVQGGGEAILVSKTWRQGDVEVFDFEVEGLHNFYVRGEGSGAAGVLVHNSTLPTSQRLDGTGPIHHLATNKNFKSSVRGGPWSPRFKEMFDKAGVDLDDIANKVRVPGHKGPHSKESHQYIYDRLGQATEGLEGDAYRDALLGSLDELAAEAQDVGSFLNKELTKQ